MNPDDPVCLCFHVTRRKLLNFIRVEKPRRASQLSECFGAGTGCGWCRNYLERLLTSELNRAGDDHASTSTTNRESESADKSASVGEPDVSFAQYARQRAEYVRRGGGTPPPGAIPLDEQN